MLRRVELPQIKIPLLAREDPADEHNLDYINKPDWLVHQGLDACLQSDHLFFVTPRQARLFPGHKPRGGPDRNSGAAVHSGSRGSVI